MSNKEWSSEARKHIDRYVDRLCREMQEPEAKIQDFREEMTMNLQSSVEEFLAQGEDEQEAIRRAIQRFGEFHTVKEELKQLYRIKHTLAQSVLRAALSMLMLGILIMGLLIGVWNEWLYDKYPEDVYRMARKKLLLLPLTLTYRISSIKSLLNGWSIRGAMPGGSLSLR